MSELKYYPPKEIKFEKTFEKLMNQMMKDIFGGYPKKPTKLEKKKDKDK